MSKWVPRASFQDSDSMDKPTDEEVRATITDIAFLLVGDLQRIVDRSGWPGGVVYNVFMKEFNRMWDERKK